MKLFIVIPGLIWLAGRKAITALFLFVFCLIGFGYLLGMRLGKRT